MLTMILLVLFYLLFPVVIILICRHWTLAGKIGTIVIAYAIGLLIGTSGIFGEGSTEYKKALLGRSSIPSAEMEVMMNEGRLTDDDIMVNKIKGIQDLIQTATILLAFPLILFSLNLRKWLMYAKPGFLSVVLALISGVVMVTAGFFIWKDTFPDTWKLAGMFEGIYTGGTPNFAALKLVLNIDADRFVVLNTYDIIVGAFLVLFFITVAPRIFRFILPKYRDVNGIKANTDEIVRETENLENFSGMLKKETFFPLMKAFGLTLLIAAAGGGLSMLIPPE